MEKKLQKCKLSKERLPSLFVTFQWVHVAGFFQSKDMKRGNSLLKNLRVWVDGNIKTTRMIHVCHTELLANILKLETPCSLNLQKYECFKLDTKAYTEPCQTFKVKHFAKIVNSWNSLTISTKRAILYVWQGSEYTSGIWQWAYHNKARINKCFLSIVDNRTPSLYCKCVYLILKKIERNINYDYLRKNGEFIWIT